MARKSTFITSFPVGPWTWGKRSAKRYARTETHKRRLAGEKVFYRFRRSSPGKYATYTVWRRE